MLLDVDFTDTELVQRARTGDQWAFSVLFERHRQSVVAVCRGRLRSDSDVEDAVQEAFARALGKLHQLRDSGQFGAWVRSIAIRACMDHHQAARRVVALDSDDHSEVEDVAPRPDEVVEAAEEQATVHSYLAELGARDRHALWLRHVREAPVSTVASELGLTEGSARVMLARARQRLRAAATGIGVFVPLSWRQWFRDHMHAPMPAFDAIAMVVAFTIAGGVASAGPPAKPSLREPAAAVSVERRADRPRAKAKQVEIQADRERRPQRADRTAAAPPAVPTIEPRAGAPVESPRRSPIERVRDSVDVRREYPNEDETDELADVTVFANEQENTVRLYGDEVAPLVAPAGGAADALLGDGAESDAP